MTAAHCFGPTAQAGDQPVAFAPGFGGTMCTAGTTGSAEHVLTGCGGHTPFGIWNVTEPAHVPAAYYHSPGTGQPTDGAYDVAFVTVTTSSSAPGKNLADVIPPMRLAFDAPHTSPITAWGYPTATVVAASGNPQKPISSDQLGWQHCTGTPTPPPAWQSQNLPGSQSAPSARQVAIQCTTLSPGASGGPWIDNSTGAVDAVTSAEDNEDHFQKTSQPTEEDGTWLTCTLMPSYLQAAHLDTAPPCGSAAATPNTPTTSTPTSTPPTPTSTRPTRTSTPRTARPAPPAPAPVLSVPQLYARLTSGGFACTDFQLDPNTIGARDHGVCQHDGDPVDMSTYTSQSQQQQAIQFAQAAGLGITIIAGNLWVIGALPQDAPTIHSLLGGQIM
jgi:hypothetical protein